MRKDAEQGRAALRLAAAAEFVQRGIEAPLDAIAHRAGVGRAMLYRCFADRDEHVCAMFTGLVDELGERMRQTMIAAGTSASSPSQAAGTVRADPGPGGIRLLAALLGAGLETADPTEREAISRRTRALVLDGLKTRS